MEVGWAPAEVPTSEGYTSKNHREDMNGFFHGQSNLGAPPNFTIYSAELFKEIILSLFHHHLFTCAL